MEKLSRQSNSSIRKQSFYSELLLRYALQASGYIDKGPLNLTTGKYGKPSLEDRRCFFNLSHSADIVFCAVSDREIGADVQIQAKSNPELIRRYFCEDEQEFVFRSSDPDAAFTSVWTRKESYCKRDGRGLAVPLNSFSVFDEKIIPSLGYKTVDEYHFAVCAEDAAKGDLNLIRVEPEMLSLY